MKRSKHKLSLSQEITQSNSSSGHGDLSLSLQWAFLLLGKSREPGESKEHPGDNTGMKTPFGEIGVLGGLRASQGFFGLMATVPPPKMLWEWKKGTILPACFYLKAQGGDHFPYPPESSAVHNLGTTHLLFVVT